jgi:dihydroxy-acid dehydratase
MGTASTMACIAETLGMSLPGTAAIPAVHSARLVAAEESGKAAVRLIANPITPARIITRESVENAFRVLMALGGSTNAIIHLTAIAGRAGIRIPMERLNAISDETPVLVDLKPVGEGYMEDFFAAGGVGAVLRELRPLLHLDTIDVEGRTLRERLEEPLDWVDPAVIRPASNPVSPVGGLIALQGSLAPDGAIFKRAAATPALFETEGRAVVFEDLEDLSRRIDDPDLDVTATDVLVLKNAGPHAAGMPEAGYLPIPKKLAQAGVKDMVRVSDARMSGTAFGTIVLHVAPEAATGGPLAAVRNGDRIRLSVAEKRIDLLVDEAEIRRRLADHRPPPKPVRGYKALYRREVTQAPDGCDFRFLMPDAD